MPNPVKVVFNADTGQFVSQVDGATKAVTKQADAVALAKNKVLEAFKEQQKAAKENGASAEELARIQTRASENLASVTEKNAGRVIAALDRIEEKRKRVQAELQNLGPVPEGGRGGDDITNKQRASALLRGGGIRSAENFASQFELFNKISTIAFPILGAATMVAEVVKGVAAIKEMHDEADKLASSISLAFGGLTLSMRSANDALDLTNAKLEVEIAKIERKPVNNAAVALREATVEANNFAVSLANDAKGINDVLSANKLSALAGLLTGKGATASVASSIQVYMNDLQALGNQLSQEVARGDENAAKATRQKIEAKRDSGKSWAKSKLFVLDNPQFAGPDDDVMAGADNAGNRADVLGFQGVLLEQEHRERSQATNTTDQARLGEDQKKQAAAQLARQNAERAAAAERKAMEAQRKGWENQDDARKDAGGDSAVIEVNTWAARLAKLKVGSDQYLYVQHEVSEHLKELRAKDAADAKAAAEKWQRTQREGWESDHEDWTEAAHRTAADEALYWQLRMLEADQGSQNYLDAKRKAHAAELSVERETVEANRARFKAGIDRGNQDAAYRSAATGLELQTGAISRLDAAQQLANIHLQEYLLKQKELQAELTTQKDADPDSAATVNAQAAVDRAAADRKIQIMEDAAHTAAETWSGAMRDANSLWVQDSQDSAKQVVALYQTAINGTNANIIQAFMGKHGHTDFKGVGQDLAKQGAGFALRRAESPILSALGMNKADGSKSNPFSVIIANMEHFGSGLASSVGSRMAGDSDSEGQDPDSSSGGGIMGMIASMGSSLLGPFGGLVSMFGGHRALGGGVQAGMAYDVGEMGRETFVPSSNGTIIPNNKIGGNAAYYTVNVADGVTPTQMRMHVDSALKEFHPKVVASSVAAMGQHRDRNPLSKR